MGEDLNKNLVWQKSIFPPPKSDKILETLPLALFKRAMKSPDSAAVITNEQTYSFSDLVNRVAGLSKEIDELSKNDGPIALVQKNGLNAIAAWFACSLSGKPFLLLEPNHPTLRLIKLIKAADCSLVLVDESTAPIFKDFKEINHFISDGRFGVMQQNKGLSVDEPAMIFPTSGSTGEPKLITYSFATIQVKVQSSIEQMLVPKGARVLIAGSHSNYGFLHHALVFLLSGGAVCLADLKTYGFDAILNSINNHGVRHVRFTPSLFRKLVLLPKAKNTLQLLNGVRFSGEPLLQSDLKLAQAVLNSNCLIQNVYGSTESSLFVWSNLEYTEFGESEIVPIGKIYPLSSFAIQPLEDKDTSKGELLIKSKFHALGDLKNGVIDTERFPLLENSRDERIYRTGDIVQQLPNGDLIVLGRLGRMVKIRGNRVFLNEVENHLRRIANVSGAAVVDFEFRGEKVLFGFLTIEENSKITAELVRFKLAESLPDFMIPKYLKILSNIPLLEGGKVDYNFLISLISNDEIEYEPLYSKDDFARLSQLWDSVLWKGAHKFYSDFISLGGDSLSFMTLIARIEHEFGQKVSLQEFKANSTFPALAIMLEIKIPENFSVTVNENLQMKLFAPCEKKTSKGIALAMPGFKGWTQAYPFYKAGLFEDYDIWVAEYPVNKGFIIHFNQWWNAALEIVESIREGKIQKPQIIFGFSFSGGLAWLVSRLLSGTPQSPEFVVMVDSPPIHRLKKYNHKALRKELNRVVDIKPIPSIHIKRTDLLEADGVDRKKYDWNTLDNISFQVDLPTVEHLEMVNWKMLSLSKETVDAFINKREVFSPRSFDDLSPDLLGVHIYYAFKGNENALAKVIAELNKGLAAFSLEHLMNITILMYVKNNKKARELMDFTLNKLPSSGSVQFLNRRIKRRSNMIINSNIPSFFPSNITDIELLLAKRENANYQPRLYRILIFTLDLGIALLVSNYYNVLLRIKKK